MKELNPEPREWSEPAQIRHIEPDWAESEWFQVWLELARLPHKSDTVRLELEFEESETSCLVERSL